MSSGAPLPSLRRPPPTVSNPISPTTTAEERAAYQRERNRRKQAAFKARRKSAKLAQSESDEARRGETGSTEGVDTPGTSSTLASIKPSLVSTKDVELWDRLADRVTQLEAQLKRPRLTPEPRVRGQQSAVLAPLTFTSSCSSASTSGRTTPIQLFATVRKHPCSPPSDVTAPSLTVLWTLACSLILSSSTTPPLHPISSLPLGQALLYPANSTSLISANP